MNKTFKRIRIAYTAIALAEIITIAILCILFSVNEGFRKSFSGLAALTFTLIFIVFNVVFVGMSIIRVYYLRQQSDLKAATLIGQDIQEAYNFGMIGLVVTDENDIVLWTNDLFSKRNVRILDQNIVEWEPKLNELKNAELSNTVKIVMKSRNYEVKYLRDAKLYIFKDITDLENLSNYTKEKEIVVGIIMIDNFSDIPSNTEDSNDVISKIRNAIFDYAKEHRVLLRRYRNDAYFAICNYASLLEMQNDQFSLLEKARILGAKETTPPTLSLGFAYNFPDVTKLNDMANDAIDIAMSRGGDQVVVAKYGDDLVFYGGKTEALETRNKVKVRVLADSLIAAIKNAKTVIVLGHIDADMDAIGGCLGIMAMCKHLKKPCRMVYDPKLVEKKARAAFNSSFTKEEITKMVVNPRDVLDEVKPTTLIVLVDCHRPSLSIAPKLIEKAPKIVVIDHHRRSEEFVEMPVFSYVEPSASSVSELISELIHYCSLNPHINVPGNYATIMLSGIFLDSNFFKSKTTGIRTFEASMLLKEFGADNSLADDFLKDEFEEYSLITQIASTLKTPHVGVVYCVADEKYTVEPSTLAKVANQCMQMKGVNASFVIGKVNEKEARISCRSDGSINVQLLSEKMGGGGHFTAAAVPLKNMSVVDGEKALLETLNTYLKKATTIEVKGSKQ